jgi:hypothetical protein
MSQYYAGELRDLECYTKTETRLLVKYMFKRMKKAEIEIKAKRILKKICFL